MNIKGFVDFFKQKLDALLNLTKKIYLPKSGDLSLYDVGQFFIKALSGGTLGIRSASIAFNFFMAIFPAVLFLFTLIPYIPINNFQSELISILEQVIPEYTFESIEETLVDIAMNPRSGLLSIGCITTIVLVSNGITAMIRAFNSSVNVHETRSFLNLRLSSLIMMGAITVLLSVAIMLLIFGRTILSILISKRILFGIMPKIAFYLVQWIVILFLCLACVSVIYYFAPAKRTKMGFISAGSLLATTLLLVTSWGFGFYLSNFSQYNALYGSIGTLIAILVWLNLNSSILLLGFELNLSIKEARIKKDEQALVIEPPAENVGNFNV